MTESHVLYRKYRPQEFGQVRGQEQIVGLLQKAVTEKKPAHAYLFTGGRGTGKTTLARIFAKSLGVHEHDIVEMDAASNRGVDDIRALREATHVQPLNSPYKIYIIDEVHMLTKEAFNALLKTLEEPPAHVLFVLATTELDRVPDTIRSRCQVLRFQTPDHKTLESLITDVAKLEGNTIDEDCVRMIVRAGDGSFRDTLGALQQVLGSGTGASRTGEDARRALSLGARGDAQEFISALVSQEERVFEIAQKFDGKSKELERFIGYVLDEVRRILLARYAPGVVADELIFASEEERSFIEASSKNTRITSDLLEHLLAVSHSLHETPHPHIALTLGIAKWFEK